MITPFHPAVNIYIIHTTLVEEKNIIILRRRRCYVVTEVDIVGTVPRAVRNTARSGNRPYDEHYGYINTSTPYPRQRWTRPSFPSDFSLQPLTFSL
jgi:hypothetical protein